MATISDVLTILRPAGGWIVHGDTFDGIKFVECEPVTKAEFDKVAKTADAIVSTTMQNAEAKREAVFIALAASAGLEVDEVKAALGA